jgi:predicted Zn-dependent protease
MPFSKTTIYSFLFGVVLSTSAFAQSNFKLPDLGTSAIGTLSIEKEQVVGEVMMKKIRGSSNVISDPLLDEYVNNLGNRLVAHADDIRFPFQFFWIGSNDINAFAFYGGHVGVHTGLMANADSESQLASVLGHEIAHVTQRHLARRLEQQKENSGLTLAGMIAGILTTIVAPDAGMAILSASQTQAALGQLTYGRSAEQESDRIGMKIMHNAGFDPHASGEFLGKLADQTRHSPKPPVFLLTHPLPDSRVSDVRMRAQQYPERYVDSSANFYLAKSRVVARFVKDPKDAEQDFRKYLRVNKFGQTKAAKYGLAITLVDQKKYAEAEVILTKLREEEPNNLFYLDTYTDLKLGQKQYKQALETLHLFYQRMPNNQVVTLNYANAALESGDVELAEKILRFFLLDKPSHPLAMDLLAATYKKANKQADYHETRAGIFAGLGLYAQASNEVQKSLNHIEHDDKIKQQRLKALLKDYRLMQKELAKL